MEILISLYFSKIINTEVYYLEQLNDRFECFNWQIISIEIKKNDNKIIKNYNIKIADPSYMNTWIITKKENLIFIDYLTCITKAHLLTSIYYNL
jgi:hypothetical protein